MLGFNVVLSCLKNERAILNLSRVLSASAEVVRVISGGRESGNLGAYLERNPLYKNQFNLGATIEFRVPGTQPTMTRAFLSLQDFC